MGDGGFEQFLREFESGAPTPVVDPADIKRIWELTNRLQADARERGVQGFVSFAGVLYEDACGPGANVAAVWLRTGLLQALQQSGLLKPWKPDSEFEKRLFEVVAVFPVAAGNFDADLLVEQLGDQEN
jgi:hypothetical protein